MSSQGHKPEAYFSDKQQFARRVRFLRVLRGENQEQFDRSLGTSKHNVITRIETGRVSCVPIKRFLGICKLAREADVPVDWLMGADVDLEVSCSPSQGIVLRDLPDGVRLIMYSDFNGDRPLIRVIDTTERRAITLTATESENGSMDGGNHQGGVGG